MGSGGKWWDYNQGTELQRTEALLLTVLQTVKE